MFNYYNIRDLHLEITSRCQASCPMCIRNHHGGRENKLLELHDWSIEDFKKRIPEPLLKQLSGFYFCGNLGDPIINIDLLEMIKYSVSKNPSLFIRVHTNGGARSTLFWENLASVLPENHLVIFSLDGLSDTHSLYRIGTKFETVLENAKIFIEAGGNAEWSFIKFKHNEHQVVQAETLAKKIGFKSFIVKSTSRFILEETFYVEQKGIITHYLEPPSDMPEPIITQEIIDNYRSIVQDSIIDCTVKKDNSLYIDCRGILYPCCWIASLPWTEESTILPIQHMIAQYQRMCDFFKGEDNLNTSLHSIKNILSSEQWQDLEKFLWHEDKFIMCSRTCGKTKEKFMKSTNQNIEIKQL